jgi:hypothetical protein
MRQWRSKGHPVLVATTTSATRRNRDSRRKGGRSFCVFSSVRARSHQGARERTFFRTRLDCLFEGVAIPEENKDTIMQVEQEVRGDKDEDAEDILYDDLMEAKVTSSSTSTPTPYHNKSIVSNVALSRNDYPKSFTQQVEELKSQVDSIQSENQRLKRNIGTLFRTARSELQRKDAEIARLTEALDRVQHKQSQQPNR